ncbi:hypothetical protein F5Y18DRAFT_376803 [Xylariaceae sp. FL1019]|nr:hypothetical protein F5Y18DRAFT_376803 [Xylariaceae sp. FL1019]
MQRAAIVFTWIGGGGAVYAGLLQCPKRNGAFTGDGSQQMIESLALYALSAAESASPVTRKPSYCIPSGRLVCRTINAEGRSQVHDCYRSTSRAA